HPVLHGSAVTGAGVAGLVDAIRELLPTPDNEQLARQPLAAEVFKVGRDSGGARTAYVRLSAGSIRRRDRVPVGDRRVKVTAAKGFSGSSHPEERPVRAGEEFGVAAEFSPPAAVHIERPTGSGTGLETIGGDHRLTATVGLWIAPGRAGSGVRYIRPTEFNGVLPRAFHAAIAETVPRALAAGPHGWPVTDAVVTLTATGYDSATSTAADFRLLVPLVLAGALAEAGTTPYEPLLRLEIDLPTAECSRAMTELLRRGASVEAPKIDDHACVLTGVLPADAGYQLTRDLASFTGGEGVLVTTAGGWRQLRHPLPERRRRGPNPFNRVVYLREIAQGARV
ncbi:MAG: hypothetical protein M3Y77_22100, partial [Actinomycetota bacterium]|nr:hypothetical protein [Actinomycetota bacterium]